ncbi:MAG: Sec-independent protein translocase subunit TatC, sec-independent protein translocase protein TatC [Candidatus Saccharibacteria bacterium]|nr:Sec-independent protein translocase subunit TatC, sec-independent protein translocase protein TatC [Candidatus Saccharibacteria bacterium]
MLDHVRELRLRLFACVAVLVVGGVVGYLYYEPILAWLRTPLGTELYYSSPAGSFNFVMKVAAIVGIGLAMPVIVYNLIKFIKPAFENFLPIRKIIFISTMSLLLAVSGAAFAFYMIIPGALKFFTGFEVSGLSALITADSYLSFVANVMVTFIIMFQIPLLILFIDYIKPLKPSSLFKGEKYAVLGGLVVSFFVPFALDITTSLLIALPIIALYNLSIGLVIGQHAIRKRQQARRPVVENIAFTLEDTLVDDLLAPEHRAKPIEDVALYMPKPLLNGRAMFLGVRRPLDMKPAQISSDQMKQQILQQRAEEKERRFQAIQSSQNLRVINDIF